MFKKVKEFIVEMSKSAVSDIMEFSGMDANELDDLSTISKRGFIAFSILMGIGLLTLFAGWTVITWFITVYNILNWATICIGVYYLTEDILIEMDKRIEEIQKGIEELKNDLF